LERATKLTRRMVTQWGMSRRLGPVSYKMSSEDPFLGREMHSQRQFSEHTLQIIDEEVARILHTASEQAQKILSDNRDKLDAMAEALIDREELGEAEITELIGPSIQRRREEAEKVAEEFEEHTNGSPAGEKSKHSASAGASATPAAHENGQETA
jgi:cell division protease FtsH